MDSEEHIEIKQAAKDGYPYTDEGPYYHHAWWEAYKGGVKGKLGGLVIGAVVGAVAGVIAATALTLATGGLGAVGIAAVIGGFAAGGMMYGVHEFSEIGHVSGAVAAGNELAEMRMRTFEEGKFAEIQKDLAEIKSNLKGASTSQHANSSEANGEHDNAIERAKLLDNYRTTHFQPHHSENLPAKNRLIFWRIAAIGLVVGLAAGALLVGGGFMEPLMHGLGSAFGGTELGALIESTAGKYIASMTAMGAIGASFGVNRDIFRKIFDKTDLWFRGLFSHNGHSQTMQSVERQIEKKSDEKNTAQETALINLVEYEQAAQHADSNTYHRDKVLAAAQKALLSIDPNSAIRH